MKGTFTMSSTDKKEDISQEKVGTSDQNGAEVRKTYHELTEEEKIQWHIKRHQKTLDELAKR